MLKFKILDAILAVSGNPSICEFIADDYPCLLFPLNPPDNTDFHMVATRRDIDLLIPAIPEWALPRVDSKRLVENDGQNYTTHVFDKKKLFVCTRLLDGSIGRTQAACNIS